MTAEERLRFHQEHSEPIMDELHGWLEAQFAERKTEPNSSLGKAITYLLRHWKALTLFLREAGRPWIIIWSLPLAAVQRLCRLPDYAVCSARSCGFSLGDLSFWGARLSA